MGLNCNNTQWPHWSLALVHRLRKLALFNNRKKPTSIYNKRRGYIIVIDSFNKEAYKALQASSSHEILVGDEGGGGPQAFVSDSIRRLEL